MTWGKYINWGDPKLTEFLAKMDREMSDELRLVLVAFEHIDARLGHLHVIGYYANAALTAIVILLLLK